jgi:hypothetical protein
MMGARPRWKVYLIGFFAPIEWAICRDDGRRVVAGWFYGFGLAVEYSRLDDDAAGTGAG